MKNFAVLILGPTCTGKTSLAVKIAENAGEIISVDSMQIYKYMDIGTAKPSQSERKKVKHHLIDIITPDIQFTAGNFIRYANDLINDIISRNKIPFLVGGTGLYFLSLTRGMIDIPKINPEVKKKLIIKHDKIGQLRMYNILKRLDEKYAQVIHPNDKQRTLRALEVIIGSGRKFSDFLNQNNIKENDFKYITVGLNAPRNVLYEKINLRVDKMIEAGLVGEVKELINKGYSKNDPGMKGIGYKEILDHLDGVNDLERTIYLIKQNSRKYAKRQFTWFNKMNDIKWFDFEDQENCIDYINKEIDNFK